MMDARHYGPTSSAPLPRFIPPNSRILILTVTHGASHERLGRALERALRTLRRDLSVRVVNALEQCAPWFRTYYDSYKVPLKYCPRLWGWIESVQHRSRSTGPGWLFRKGAQPLFHFIENAEPGAVVATEVGLCEIGALMKRDWGARYRLIGAPTGVDIDRAWAQPEVDLYLTAPGDTASQLEQAGAPRRKILPCGMPVDPAFTLLPDRAFVRAQLQIDPEVPLLLVLFGGAGHGAPQRILPELERVQRPLQVVFIAGKNPRLERYLRRATAGHPRCRVLGWTDNVHEWMAAADLLLSKPGGSTLIEAIDSGLPLLAFEPLPGGERRACQWIENAGIGVWVKHSTELAPAIEDLLARRNALSLMRNRARRLARPFAASEAAQAILGLISKPSWPEELPIGRLDKTQRHRAIA